MTLTKAATQGHYSSQSPFTGTSLAEDMGVGKTKTCIKIINLAGDKPDSFSLVLYPKLLQSQWVQEIHDAYSPVGACENQHAGMIASCIANFVQGQAP